MHADKLRSGDQIENFVLGNNHFMHRYDDILLPHWKEIADALVQYQKFEYRENHGIDLFIICNVELHSMVLELLAPAVKKLNIKKLFLGKIIGIDLVSFTSDIIQANKNLEGICLRENRIERKEDMQCLCNSIKDSVAGSSLNSVTLESAFDGSNSEMMHTLLDASHHLKTLQLNNNGIGTEGLGLILDSSIHLEVLALNDNGIGSEGAHLIANWLASNPPLKHLYLRKNDLNDDSALLLANALQSNNNLKHFVLNDNDDITSVGRHELLVMLFNVSSLNACVASNHSCHIFGIEPDLSVVNQKKLPSMNRVMKIFTILSATDDEFFNMNCLGDVSYKLIPDVLSLAQKFKGRTLGLSEAYFEQTGQRSADWNKLDKKTVPITSMFEFLRGWAVPSLAEMGLREEK